MREYLKHTDLYAYICMLQGADARLIFVLEGVSDVRSLERQVNPDECIVVAGYGKLAILGALARLEVAARDRCVGLVDRDFSDLLDEYIPSNVVLTELYDREADLLLRANLMDHYIEAIAEPAKKTQLLSESGDSNLRAAVIRIAAIVGKLRWYSVSKSLGLNLSKFPIGSVLKRPLTLEFSDLSELAVKRTSNCTIHPDLLVQHTDSVVDNTERMCSGHDLVSILAVSSTWWTNHAVGRREINNHIAAAIRLDVLMQLRWFSELSSWATIRGHKIWQERPTS